MLGIEEITVYRTTGSSWVDGVWTRGAESTLEVDASVQPMTSRDLAMLLEGERVSGQLKMYVLEGDDDLRTAEVGSEPADQVEYNGERYEIHAWDRYGAVCGTLAHSRYRLVRIGTDEQEVVE